MSRAVVTLGDASLTTADISLLVPPNWLNDQLLSFWLEHLRLNVLRDDHRVGIVLPNISYFISLTNDVNINGKADEEDLRPVAKAHRLHEKQLVVIPVNDTTVTDVENAMGPAGAHWSLLVFSRRENTLFYLDSIYSASRRRYIAQHLSFRFLHLCGAQDAAFKSLKPPGQNNSYDCERCIQRFVDGHKLADMFGKGEQISQEQIDYFRQEIASVACRLVDEKHGDDSTAAGSHGGNSARK